MVAFEYGDRTISLEIAPRMADVSGLTVMPLLTSLPKVTISQTAVQWNADLGGMTATGEPVTANATDDSSGTNIVAATLPIGINRFRHTFSVKTTKMAEAAAVGEGALAGLLAIAGKAAMAGITRSMAGAVYTGTGDAASGGVVGLASLHSTVVASKSSNAYAGIDPATYGRWTNYVNTAGTNRALTTDLMMKMSEEVIGGSTVGTNNNWTRILASPAMCTRYKSLFQATSELNAQPNGLADVGYSGMSFEGRPIYMDPYCPANRLYFIDESALTLHTFYENGQAFGEEEVVEGMIFKMVELSRVNPDAVQFGVVSKNQLAVSSRPAVAVLDGIVQ